MYIAPLIAGTNRKAYLLRASFALKDSHCHRSSILLRINNWYLCNIYILMIYRNGRDQLKAIWPMRTKNDWSRDRHWLSWTGGSTIFEQLMIKSPYLSYRLQRSHYIKSDSYIRQFWLTVRKNIAPGRVQWETPVIRDRSRSRDVFMLKIASRWQSVNQWKSTIGIGIYLDLKKSIWYSWP